MSRPLRIAVFAHEFPALSETFVLNQVTGLIDRGHSVTILAGGARPEPRVHPDVERYGLAAHILYPRMPKSRLRRTGLAALLLVRHGWRHGRLLMRCLDVRRYGRAASSLRLFYWAVRLIDDAPFDIVHCHFGPVGQFAAMLRDAGGLHGRIVTVFHGVDISAFVRDNPDVYCFLFRNGDLFLPISQTWRRKLIELGCDPRRIAVHRMGVDAGRYAFRPRRHRPDRPLRVLTVGRFVEKKGIEYGIRAVAELARRGMAVRYAIVGGGPLADSLARLAAELGAAGHIDFLGWQEQTAVSALMAESDILLAPSVTSGEGDQEGIPVALMEAMASGMLVVATRHSGIPELIEHRRSGLLVPERDSAALAAALARLARHPGAWTVISHAARRRIEAEFEVATLNDRLVRRFAALLSDREPPAEDPAGTKAAAPTRVRSAHLVTD